MANKENILKRIGEFLDTMFKEEKPIETPEVAMAAPAPEEKPVEEPTPAPTKELKVGDPIPDGEYEIADQMVLVKGGVIEQIMPMDPEEMAKKKKAKCEEETKMSSDIKVELQKEFENKLKEQKDAFEVELKKLTDAKQASGIIQAPVEVKTEPRVYSAKEIIMRNAEEKRNNK